MALVAQKQVQNLTSDLAARLNTSGGTMSGALSITAGTKSAPGLSISGETSTGLFQPAATVLSLSANGKEALRLNTATNAVNYLAVTPSAASSKVTISVEGTDSNIGINLSPKGTGNVNVTSNALVFGSGAGTSGAIVDAGSSTSSVLLPKGTVAQRPTATAGMIRYNTDNSVVEAYTTTWESLITTSTLTATSLSRANNLSDLANASTARTNLGLAAMSTVSSVTLTGDVTGTGTSSLTATIANNAVTLAKMQQIAATTLLGNSSGSTANVATITIGSGLSLSSGTLSSTAAGTVTSVGLSTDNVIFSTPATNSPITTSGTLELALKTQVANKVLSGPSTGVDAAPTFRSLVGADLPNPSSTTLGGVRSAAVVSNQWINSISTSGVPALSQPAFTNISGSVAASQMPALTGNVTTSAGNVATTIANNVVTYAKFQQVAASSLVGNATGSLANATGITLGSTLVFSGSALQTSAFTGDVTTSANSYVTTIANNAVSNTKFRQSEARSVVGNGTNATANVTDLVGTTNQVLRVDSAGTTLGFGAINLASTSAVVGNLPVANLNSGTNASPTTFFRGDGVWTSPHRKVVLNKVVDYSVLDADVGTLFTNSGASSVVILALPPPTIDLSYSFYVHENNLLILQTVSSTIRNGVDLTSNGGTMSSSSIGSYVKITAISSTEWIVEYMSGTWTIT